MEKTKKVANLAGISSTIMDDTLYQLSDVEQQFGIAQIELIQRASKLEDPLIKLCFSPPVETVIHVVDTAFICINGFNYRNRDPALPAFDKKVDQPQIFHNHKFIAMILSSDSCEGLRRTTTVEQSLFMEAYAISDFNKKPIDGSIKLVRPKMTYTQNHDMNRVDSNRLRFAAYPRWVNWQFSERNGFQPPDNITISRSDLCIYGSELKRFMVEVDGKGSASIIVQNNESQENAHTKAQASLKVLVAEVEKRAKANGSLALNGRWPGIKEDFVALVHAWAQGKEEHSHLMRSPFTIQDHLKGIIKFGSGSRQTDFYLDLFPEFRESILKYRDCIKNKPKTKG